MFQYGYFIIFSLGFLLFLSAQSCAAEADLESMLDDDFDDEEEVVISIADPLEPMNRIFFKVNDSLYFWVVKPVGKVYSSVLPIDIRVSISDVFYNALAPIRVVNHLLQGDLFDSGTEFSRFVINLTLGAGGLGDPAGEEFGIVRKDADFGQTLGKYGIGDGFYICWPVIGPSSARDSVGLAGDYFLNPLLYGLKGQGGVASGLYVWKYENEATLHGDQYETIINEAFDSYVSLRDIYMQYRRGTINNRSGSGREIHKKPDSFQPARDCVSFSYHKRYRNKIQANHHEQCRHLQGDMEHLLRYTQAGIVYYGVQLPDRY